MFVSKLNSHKDTSKELLRIFVEYFSKPVWAAGLSFIVYFFLAFFRGTPWGISGTPYFGYLADAFLHGQMYLRLIPPSVYDLSFYQGHYYLYWPPFPAILMIPIVLLFGTHFSDIFLTLVISSVNVGLVAALLNAADAEGLFHLSTQRRLLMVLFFAFGTVQLTLAPNGLVWFIAQEIGFMFVALTYLIALRLKGGLAFFLAGLCIACALATRNQLLFAGIWPAWYLLKKNWSIDYKKMAVYILLGLFPVLFAGLGLIYYNVTRFGNPLEFGITYQNMSPFFKPDFEVYGAFNIHYVPINLFYQYIYYPFLGNRSNFFMGGSLFLLSPIFFGIFTAAWYYRKDHSVWFLFISIVLVSIPILLLMGTGWQQVGPRYTLDFTVPLLLLAAMGIQHWRKNILLICFLISSVHYSIGFFLLKMVIG